MGEVKMIKSESDRRKLRVSMEEGAREGEGREVFTQLLVESKGRRGSLPPFQRK